MKFDNTKVFNFEGALVGMRNPLNSWGKSDSHYLMMNQIMDHGAKWIPYHIGNNDLELAQKLILAGNEHAKFMRQIMVSVDITAPLYWWKEMDTYKVATVANSTSTMHKLASTPITLDCFEIDDYNFDLVFESGIDDRGDNPWEYDLQVGDVVGTCEEEYFLGETIIGFLESLRQKYLETKDVRYWKELIRWLPEGWLQTRTWTANYAVLRNIYFQRRNHKLSEWHSFCRWIESLPYAKELITLEKTA